MRWCGGGRRGGVGERRRGGVARGRMRTRVACVLLAVAQRSDVQLLSVLRLGAFATGGDLTGAAEKSGKQQGGPIRGGLCCLTLDSLRSAHRLCGPCGRGGAWESRERPPTARLRLLRCDSYAGRVGRARRCVDTIRCGRVGCASRAPVTPERHAPSAGLYGLGAMGSGSAVDWNGYPLGSLLSSECFPRGACACRGHPPIVAGVAAVRVRPHCRMQWRLWSEPVFRVLAAWP